MTKEELERRAKELGIDADDNTWDDRELGADEQFAKRRFDPNATPLTNKNKFWLSEIEFLERSEIPVTETWFSEELEQRARTAEEKLRIAVEGLIRIQDMEDILLGKSVEAWMATEILEEIERIGK